MTYAQAKKLHNGDEVTIKESDRVMTVVTTEVHKKVVIIMLDDGNMYHHRDVK